MKPGIATPFLQAGIVACFAAITGGCAQSAQPTHHSAAPPPPAGIRSFGFEGGAPGNPPPGFTPGLTGGGGPVRWEVQDAEGAPEGSKVVAQLSEDRTNARYPHLVCDDFSAADVDVSVKFKTLSGEVDASGGIVFRYQDSGNYYVVRANSLEGNVVAYITENGKRRSIGVKGMGDSYGVDVPVPHLQWNTLRVIARGSLFEIFLNGRKLFEVENPVIDQPGKVGLWTKADAVTQFDALSVSRLDKK